MKPDQSQSENSAGQSGIRVLTVSLFIILLAFFIVLNSIAVVDERRKLEALGSLIGSFGILPGGLSPLKSEGKSILLPETLMLSREDEFRKVLGLDKQVPGLVSLWTSPEGKVISIHDRVIFDEESCKIRPSTYGFLKRLCDIINHDKYPVEIRGNTDNRPPDEKRFRSNWEISSLRAQAVLRFFVVIGGVDPARLTGYGCGEYRPIASNETSRTRARNRRVDIILDHRSERTLKQIYRRDQSRFFVFKRFLFRMFD